jgi:hypothetical protein
VDQESTRLEDAERLDISNMRGIGRSRVLSGHPSGSDDRIGENHSSGFPRIT